MEEEKPEKENKLNVSFMGLFSMIGIALFGVLGMQFFGIWGTCICIICGMVCGMIAGYALEKILLKKEKTEK